MGNVVLGRGATLDTDTLGGMVVEVATGELVVLAAVVGVVPVGVDVVGVDVVVVAMVQPVPFSIHGPPTRPWGWVSKTNTNLMST
jgi:hypothetical protein